MNGKITALHMQKHNPDRVNVYLDGRYAFSLDVIAAARLRKGQVLSADEIAQLQDSGQLSLAYDRAVRFLATRPRSIAEVRRKLRDKDTPPEMIDAVIERLEQRGYVDDYEFARFWVRNREEFRPRGPAALRAELRAKGIASSIIDEVLVDLDRTSSALRAARQKLRSLRGLDEQTFRHKLSGFLARRGYDYETVRDVVDTLLNEIDHHGFEDVNDIEE